MKNIVLNINQWQQINGWLEEYQEELYENFKASENQDYEDENIEVGNFITDITSKFNDSVKEVELSVEQGDKLINWLDEFAEELYENYKATWDEDILKENKEVNKVVDWLYIQNKPKKQK